MKHDVFSMDHEVFQDESDSYDWRVGAVNHDSEGECYVTIFSGHEPEERAREYAAWKNAQVKAALRSERWPCGLCMPAYSASREDGSTAQRLNSSTEVRNHAERETGRGGSAAG